MSGQLAVFPFFVGCARSGTTLIRAMFDSHPQVSIPPESYFVAELGQRRRRYETPGGFKTSVFLDDLLSYRWFTRWGMEEQSVRDKLQLAGPESFAGAIRCIYEQYATSMGKSRFGDKTPSYVFSMKLIGKLFPEAKFVHIVRDGRDVALSLIGTTFGANNVVQGALFWKHRVERGRESGQRIGQDRYREIRHEDLLDDPETALTSLCRFLELEYSGAMLRYFERSDEILRRLPNPDKHLSLLLPPTKGLRDWRHQLSRDELALLEALIGPSLERFGYELASPGPTGRITGRARALEIRAWVGRMADRWNDRVRRVLES